MLILEAELAPHTCRIRRGLFRRVALRGLDRDAGLRRHAGAALRHHIAVAAGIFDETSVAFRHHDARRHAVEEIAVVTDDQRGPRVVREQFLQQVQRFEIKVVRRLVQHQQIRRRRHRLRQHQTAALAAREHANRRAHLLGREQKFPHIAAHMPRDAIDRDRIAAPVGQERGERRFRRQHRAPLVERLHEQIAAQLHFAAVGRQSPGQEIQQRRLARAVRADNADAVAAQDPHGEIAHDCLRAVAL